MGTDRDSLINYIEEYYNTEDTWELLENAMISLFGDIDDSGPEGIYSHLSDSDLMKLTEFLDSQSNGDMFEVTLELTQSQLTTLRKALSDFSDVTFTKDRQMSQDAMRILQQL